MKTLNLKSIWTVLITVIMSITFANAQEKTCTVIDVAGGGYYDRLWIFSEPGTSDGFDNGWDGYKFLKATTVSPQIYFQGPDDVFQVSTTANVNNCKIGFIPGTATEYTMSFKHTALALTYQQLFLVDHIANTITDIYPAGVTYTFTAAKGDLAERFSLITFKETNNDVTDDTNGETNVDNGGTSGDSTGETGTEADNDSTNTNNDEGIDNGGTIGDGTIGDGTIGDGGIDDGINDGTDNDEIGVGDNNPKDKNKKDKNKKDKNKKDKKDKKDKKEKVNKAKEVKVTCKGKRVVLNNPNKQKGNVKIINARTGKVVKEKTIAPECATTIETNSPTGPYVIAVTVETDINSTTVIVE